EEEDRAEREAGEDDGERPGRPYGDEAEVDVEPEAGGPQEGRDTAVDARWPQMHAEILGQAVVADLDDLRRLDRDALVVHPPARPRRGAARRARASATPARLPWARRSSGSTGPRPAVRSRSAGRRPCRLLTRSAAPEPLFHRLHDGLGKC